MSSDARLAEVLEWLWEARPPATVDAKTRELLLDTIGCVIAASSRPRLRALAEELAAADPGPASVAGFPQSFGVPSAAALFAAAACWDEACEGLARAHGRPGVAVIGACAALAQARQRTFGQVLAAIVAGYEVGGRAGEALRIGPGTHVDATWPALGVAAAAVRLCGGTASQALAAVRIAGCQIPRSLYLPVKAGAEARNTYLPHAAQLGLLAAQAAMADIGAPAGVLDELRAGSFAAPREWLILEGYLKPFAAVRHVHYPAAAALELRPKLAHRLREISRLEIATYAEALTYCSNRAPVQAIQAQFSLSYGTAHALVAGRLDPDAYSDQALRDPLVRSLEEKCELREDPGIPGRGVRLGIELGSERLECAAGDESLPMSRDDVIRKFCRYTGRGPDEARRLLEAPPDSPFASPA
jgi:2-methylcitrate dehydratase PrpD